MLENLKFIFSLLHCFRHYQILVWFILGDILLVERLATYITIVRVKRILIFVDFFVFLNWLFFNDSSVRWLIRSLVLYHKFSFSWSLFFIHKISVAWKIHFFAIFLNIFISILFFHDIFMQALFIFTIFIYNFLLRFLQLYCI